MKAMLVGKALVVLGLTAAAILPTISTRRLTARKPARAIREPRVVPLPPVLGPVARPVQARQFRRYAPISFQTRIVQGLAGYTMVAGKTTAIAIAVSGLGEIDDRRPMGARIEITRPDCSTSAVDVVVNRTGFDGFSEESWRPHPASDRWAYLLWCTIPGRELPDVGFYRFRIEVWGSGPNQKQTRILTDFASASFLPTKDLRVLVSRLYGSNAALADEIASAKRLLEFVGHLFPVRDGVAELDGERTAGIRYAFDPYTEPKDAHLEGVFRRYRNRGPSLEPCDVAVAFRLNGAGEALGGNARPNRLAGMPFAVVVGDFSTTFAHEIAHVFGTEAPASPHYNGGPHSKDHFIDESEHLWGFGLVPSNDFCLPGRLTDLMTDTGPMWAWEMVLNSYDWEFIRRKLLALPSTGPERPFSSLQTRAAQGIWVPKPK